MKRREYAPPLRVGIIGAGKMARIYLRWFSHHPDCVPAGLYNRTPDRAAELVEGYNLHFYERWDDLVSSTEIDLVGDCGPSQARADRVVAALEAGKAVLCEKPLAASLSECERIRSASERCEAPLIIGFQMRYHPIVETVTSWLPEIGYPFHIEFIFPQYRPGPSWRYYLEEGGGVLHSNCSHLFDLAKLWLGDIESVCAEQGVVTSGRQVEDHSLALLRFRSGATGMIYGTYQDRRKSAIHGAILGTDGHIEFILSPYEPGANRVSLVSDDGRKCWEPALRSETDPIYPGYLDAFAKEIQHFVDYVLGRSPRGANAQDGYSASEAVFAAYESQAHGIKVYLPLDPSVPRDNNRCFPPIRRGSSQ